MKSISLAFISLLFLFLSCSQPKNETFSLAGKWQFQIDNEDIGLSESWFNTNLDDTIQLPGSMVENGKGFDINLQTQWDRWS